MAITYMDIGYIGFAQEIIPGYGGGVFYINERYAGAIAIQTSPDPPLQARPALPKPWEKARALLHACLSLEQRRTLDAWGFFELKGSNGCMYAIYAGGDGNVYQLNGGYAVRRLCAVLCSLAPIDDHILSQKLMIENCADLFERIALPQVMNYTGVMHRERRRLAGLNQQPAL